MSQFFWTETVSYQSKLFWGPADYSHALLQSIVCEKWSWIPTFSCVDMLEDAVKFISSPKGLSSTFTFTVTCPIHFVFFLVYLVHFYFISLLRDLFTLVFFLSYILFTFTSFFSFILFTFTSFLLDFVSLNKLIALLVELKMIIFGNYSLSLMRNVTWG